MEQHHENLVHTDHKNDLPLWNKVSRIDSYFQNVSNPQLSKQGERIADRYFDTSQGKGWEGCDPKNIQSAYLEYQSLLIQNNIELETALKL
jgi:hypothetical protein